MGSNHNHLTLKIHKAPSNSLVNVGNVMELPAEEKAASTIDPAPTVDARATTGAPPEGDS